MTGLLRPPPIKMPAAVETDVEWLHAGALAPRTTKGARRRGGLGVTSASPAKSPPNKWGPFSPLSRLSGRGSAEHRQPHDSGHAPGSARGRPRERRTPTGRVRRRSSSRRLEEIAAPTTTPHSSHRSGPASAKTPRPSTSDREHSRSARFSGSDAATANSDSFDLGRAILGVKTPAPKQPSGSARYGSAHKKAPDSSAAVAPVTPLPSAPPGELAIKVRLRLSP